MSKAVYKKITYLDNGVAGNILAIGHMAGTLSQFTLKYTLTELPTAITANANKYPILFNCTSGIQGLKYCPVYSNIYKKLYMGYYIGYASQGTYYNTVQHTPTVGAIYEVGLSQGYYAYFKNGSNIHYKYKNTSMPAFNAIGYLFGNQDVNLRTHIYHCRIDLDGVQIRDLIPMKRIEDGICGMFDNISKVFYAGTAEFTGPEEEVYYNANGNITKEYTLKEKLEHINETKSLIKNAIISKGQAVADTDTFRSYADKISAIIGGGLSEEDYATCLELSKEILLPPEPEYELLSYVRNPGQSYIDTGINPYGKKIKVEFKFGPIVGFTGHTKGLFGGFSSSEGYNLFTFYHDLSSWNFYAKSGAPLVRNITNGYSIGYTGDEFEGYIEVGDTYSYRFIINNPSNNMNNVVYEGSGNVSGQFPTKPTITIFCQNSDDGPVIGDPAIANLYYFRMYLDDVIVRDFIPVKDANGVVCLYDKATRTFFYSQNGNLEGGV